MHTAQQPEGPAETPLVAHKKPSFFTIVGRSLRLRCPRCAGGRLFRGLFSMYDSCPNCKLQYERGPGYFLGSTYINYGLTALLTTITYVLLRFGAGYEKAELLVPLGIFIVLFPTVFFRYSRSLWLGIDCFIDASAFTDEASTKESDSSQRPQSG